MKQLLLIFGGTIVLAGCGPLSSKDVNPFDGEAKAAYFTSTCTAKVRDECMQYTCTSKTNESGPGNCSSFAKGCLNEGYHYAGTAEEGKCSRVI
jgi:hypothetical protein